MKGPLYLAVRYLGYHRYKTAVLVASVTLILYLPAGLRVLVNQGSAALTERAAATPLLVGAVGSPFELVLNALYFESDPPAPTTFAQAERVAASGLAEAIPVYARFKARGRRVVGTTFDYFGFRGLRTAEGRHLAVLGDCVLGASAADALGLGPGDRLVTAPESALDIAGVYPLELAVAGVLAPTGTADDEVVFVDLKTAWVIEGLGHGHRDIESGPGAEEAEAGAGEVLGREGKRVTAGAALRQFNRVGPDNVDRFHFHGERSGFPVSAVIAVPADARSAAILRGRYLSPGEASQILRPSEVIGELLRTVVRVERYLVAAVALAGASTLATAGLVFALSLRLRRRERETLFKIGASRRRVLFLMASEVVAVLVASVLIAAVLASLTGSFGAVAARALLL